MGSEVAGMEEAVAALDREHRPAAGRTPWSWKHQDRWLVVTPALPESL